MNCLLKSALLCTFNLVIGATVILGQAQTTESKDAAYVRVATERAAKIVVTLLISDSQKAERVKTTIAQQYQNLNAIHEKRKLTLSTLTESAQKEAVEAEITAKLTALHKAYLETLAHDLTNEQIDQVKDGMTYGVVPITYKGYQAMLPDLTDEQKKQIVAWLTEARERAMDEGTSEKKHAMFGKYKGRINNYLSAAGIDMKKASKEWEERIAREAAKSK